MTPRGRPARGVLARAGLAAVICLAAGCQGNTTRVSGRVVQNDQPYPFEPGERLEVTFFMEGEGPGRPPLAVPATVRPDGSFSPEFAADGNYIPSGSYKIGVLGTVYDPGVFEPKKRKFEREFSQQKTPLAFEAVPGEKVDLVIDLAAKTITVAR